MENESGSYATYGQENYKKWKRERERGWKEKEERKKELLSRLTFNSILLLFI